MGTIIATFLYTLFCVILFAFNSSVTRNKLNALHIYLTIWVCMVILYNFKIILYYDLSLWSWITLFLATGTVSMGYICGKRLKVVSKKHHVNRNKDATAEKRNLSSYILLLSGISMVAIVPNTMGLVNRYGINLLAKTTQIYYDNLNGVGTATIPYVGFLSQAAVIFAGIYFVKYKYRHFLLIPMVLAVINILPSGSRGNLILTVLFLIIPIVILSQKRKTGAICKSNIKLKKLVPLITAVVIVFTILSINRAQGIQSSVFANVSKYAVNMIENIPAIYKMYQYFTSPIGVLNAYLSQPEYSFASNTLGPLINQLNKFGANFEYSRFQTFYNIPISANVGTWIRELIMDFYYPGMLIVVFIYSCLVGYKEHVAQITANDFDLFIATVYDTILVMSFFVWYFREGFLWVILLTYCLLRFISRFSVGANQLNETMRR